MHEFIRNFNKQPKLNIDGKTLWVSSSKSPEERARGQKLGKYKKVIIEVGLAAPEQVRVDYRRGILLVRRVRVGEWKGEGDEAKLELTEARLTEAGIQVGAEALHEAVTEALRR